MVAFIRVPHCAFNLNHHHCSQDQLDLHVNEKVLNVWLGVCLSGTMAFIFPFLLSFSFFSSYFAPGRIVVELTFDLTYSGQLLLPERKGSESGIFGMLLSNRAPWPQRGSKFSPLPHLPPQPEGERRKTWRREEKREHGRQREEKRNESMEDIEKRRETRDGRHGEEKRETERSNEIRTV